jgi:poly-gamma-glutamate capsule biosynthesis protein CapA/YwtB (metallophosphatase superfamily)
VEPEAIAGAGRRPYSRAELAKRREARRRARRRRRVVALAVVAVGAASGGVAAFALGSEATVKAVATVSGRPESVKTPDPRLAHERVTIVAVGDIAINDPAGERPAPFTAVRSLLRGDVVLGNLEGTFATGGASKCTRRDGDGGRSACFAFRASKSYATAFAAAGFTVLNLANNHSGDFGPEGQRETVSALVRAGIRAVGHGDHADPLRVDRARVAVLGFAPSTPGWDLIDTAGVMARVFDAAQRADLVVVTMHAGSEGPGAAHVRPGAETFLGEQRGDVSAFARAAIDAGADLVVGHGPHVLRGAEWYRGRLIVYSLGNFAGYRSLDVTGPNGVSAILRVKLRGDGGWVRGELVPVRLVEPGVPVPDAAEEAHGLVRRLSRADFGAAAARITRAGAILRPRGSRPR